MEDIGFELLDTVCLITFCVLTWIVYPMLLFAQEEDV
jgi:hypothetical protein